MATNPNVTELDASQVIQRMYDADNDAMRVSMGSVDLAIVGDTLSASGTMTNGTTGQVIAATACAGIKEFQVYATATTATTGTIEVRIDVSPDPTPLTTTWYQSAVTLTLGSSSIGVMGVSSILNSLIAQQVEVTIVSNALNPTEVVTIHLVGNSL